MKAGSDMRIPSLNNEDGAVLLMIVIVTMALLTIGTTMLLVNSADTTVIKPIGQDEPPIVIPDPPSGNLIPSENDGEDDHFPGAENWPFAYFNYDEPYGYGTCPEDFRVPNLNTNLTTTGTLIIPPAVGMIDIDYDITYSADNGIYFGAPMQSTQGTSAITLKANEGIIKIANTNISDDGLDLNVFKDITITNTNGHIIVEPGAVLQVRQGGSKGNIIMSAGGDIDIRGVTLKADWDIIITVGGTLYLEGARFMTEHKGEPKTAKVHPANANVVGTPALGNYSRSN